jgi:hypothetical protein
MIVPEHETNVRSFSSMHWDYGNAVYVQERGLDVEVLEPLALKCCVTDDQGDVQAGGVCQESSQGY